MTPDPVPDKLTDEARRSLEWIGNQATDAEGNDDHRGRVLSNIARETRALLAARGSVTPPNAEDAEEAEAAWKARVAELEAALRDIGKLANALEDEAFNAALKGQMLSARGVQYKADKMAGLALAALAAAPSGPETHACGGMELCRRCGLPADAPVHALSIAAFRGPEGGGQ